LVTLTSQEDVARVVDREPDVVVTFELDDQSITYLRQRIHEIQTSKMQILKTETNNTILQENK